MKCGTRLYWFTFSYRSVWMVTTSAACSTPQGGEEQGGLPHPRVVTIRDPSETEGWRRTNRTLLRWWMECRRLTTERPSHLETHTQTHTTTTRSEIRSTHTEATLHKSLEISLALSFSVFVKHMNTHILSASLLPWRGRPEAIWSLLVGSVGVFDCAGLVSPSLEWHMKKKTSTFWTKGKEERTCHRGINSKHAPLLSKGKLLLFLVFFTSYN